MQHQVIGFSRGAKRALGYSLGASAATVVLLCCAGSAFSGDGAFVTNPLPRPLFAIDANSPSVLEFGLNPANIFEVDGGGPPPGTAFPGAGLGLVPGDRIDGLSVANSAITPTTIFVLLFSVDGNSAGAVLPDIAISAVFPFNTKQQAALNQAAGDEFMALGLFTRIGAPEGPASNNNTQVANQGDVGGVDHELKPDTDPETDNTGMPKDNLFDQYRPPSSPGPEGPLQPVYFSLTSGSPTDPSGMLPIPSGAAIYLDHNPLIGGDETLFASPAQLGLQMNDDIDALTVFENGDGVFQPLTEQVIFSLAPGSPTLALEGFSPADLLTTPPGGPPFPQLFASANRMGLLPTDNVDAFDVAQCPQPNDLNSCIQNFGVRIGSIPALSPGMLILMAVVIVIAACIVIRREHRRSARNC